jgi:hypothetical protein
MTLEPNNQPALPSNLLLAAGEPYLIQVKYTFTLELGSHLPACADNKKK